MPNISGFDSAGGANNAVRSLWDATDLSASKEQADFEAQNIARRAQTITGANSGQTAVAQGLATGLGQVESNNAGTKSQMQEQDAAFSRAQAGTNSYNSLYNAFVAQRTTAEGLLAEYREKQRLFNEGRLKKDDLFAVAANATSAVFGVMSLYRQLADNKKDTTPVGNKVQIPGEK